jgi:hypothetical protein
MKPEFEWVGRFRAPPCAPAARSAVVPERYTFCAENVILLRGFGKSKNFFLDYFYVKEFLVH